MVGCLRLRLGDSYFRSPFTCPASVLDQGELAPRFALIMNVAYLKSSSAKTINRHWCTSLQPIVDVEAGPSLLHHGLLENLCSCSPCLFIRLFDLRVGLESFHRILVGATRFQQKAGHGEVRRITAFNGELFSDRRHPGPVVEDVGNTIRVKHPEILGVGFGSLW